MPTYEYLCSVCENPFDVIRPMAQIDDLIECPECGRHCQPHERRISRTNFTGASDWNNQTWNPALGCYTKSNREASKIAKDRGLIELGSEKVETVHKHFDRQREETREQRWQDAARVKLHE